MGEDAELGQTAIMAQLYSWITEPLCTFPFLAMVDSCIFGLITTWSYSILSLFHKQSEHSTRFQLRNGCGACFSTFKQH